MACAIRPKAHQGVFEPLRRTEAGWYPLQPNAPHTFYYQRNSLLVLQIDKLIWAKSSLFSEWFVIYY